ncbi:unnamed protein product [Blepharisma stoltei]|uniref:Uncharacterized protein n=1 Tax=Blepharisma stoltei TaxID=1481888 RepID=A0AAU9IIH3_9CILI|nr:unnamed protein product [Blepharisma stoltei]
MLSRKENLSKNPSIEKDLMNKIQELEESKGRILEMAKDEALQYRVLLKELISADKSALELLELIEAGKIKQVKNELWRKKALMLARFQSSEFELEMKESSFLLEGSIGQAYKTRPAFSLELSSICSASDEKISTNDTIFEDLKENLKKAQQGSLVLKKKREAQRKAWSRKNKCVVKYR